MTHRFHDFSDNFLDGAAILVTGGTGSFGKAFIKNILTRHNPAKVIILSRDELKQYEMQQSREFRDLDGLRYFIGDVRDRDRLEMAMRGVDYVVHAAALKQVPAAEYNPFECIHTNVLGAENVVQAAIRNDVKKVIALSTDKAANPINLYGASKLASDKIFIAANHLSGMDGTRFSVVRYGNVIGSRGSVIPFFRQLLAEGVDELPITHPDMTRFWITLRQGVDFVLSCLSQMQGGETYVPKIPSMKITDIANCMAPGMKQRIVGIRPGEKLHEIMVPMDDGRMTLEQADRFIIQPAFKWWTNDEYAISGAKPVINGFSYSSDNNDEWLDANGLANLLENAPGDGA
ncbi:MAG: UDP-N-acetylglucosamine 4,6-dehydratase (inverting) [Rhodospirillaceae bacterium]|jgi:UDP-N-acetylglucosamine 4,6-dehydratase|nr:UDP-N-acetylglucosamine 4,6-dehydratase (inverting) [Rhodospirillaceae bacterium]MBT5081550.1 UDP-N-acetylglucosamine 4,6-dehydratase (inverting) [Rhodospirillaceae bacterium]MBT5526992.1 UDP-N-acetylglucosamine 4,6-dehydratase (inverting) [Rhodospirillaceae bacterium]MBT5881888.1 UDP-N-acetylglucosamine 4,6-dehydratase (inverting) [Rhodospirillaceae bacterium]MBT6984481.1 UDP-N-acetylglucosamine 4,6-dehydratase (inverting) [Rhodospirillaceae bacterium]